MTTSFTPPAVTTNPFKATGMVITACSSALVLLAQLCEKTVRLATNEVDSLEISQQIRLDEVSDERELLKAQRTAKRDELNR